MQALAKLSEERHVANTHIAERHKKIAEKNKQIAALEAESAQLSAGAQELDRKQAEITQLNAGKERLIAENQLVLAQLRMKLQDNEMALSGIAAISSVYDTLATSSAFFAGFAINMFSFTNKSHWGLTFRGFYLTVLALALGPLVSNLLTITLVTTSGNELAYGIQHSSNEKAWMGFNAMVQFMDRIKNQYYFGITSFYCLVILTITLSTRIDNEGGDLEEGDIIAFKMGFAPMVAVAVFAVFGFVHLWKVSNSFGKISKMHDDVGREYDQKTGAGPEISEQSCVDPARDKKYPDDSKGRASTELEPFLGNDGESSYGST